MSNNYELYERQMRTLGKDAILKINESSVAIIGLEKGLATEIAKNLVLCGIKELYFSDSKDIIIDSDLKTGYYYSTNDIGKSRTEILGSKIHELNPTIKINYQEYEEADVIICINQSYAYNRFYNKYCRKNNKKFISIQSSNNIGIVFVDVGSNHLINNITGKNYEPISILSIDNFGKVTTNGHNFQSGDTILLCNLEGINTEKINKEFIIESINKYTFMLCNYIFDDTIIFINGIANYIDKPIKINHNSYKDEYKLPTMNSMSYSDLITNYIHSDIEIIAVNSIIASIAASEAIKIISNKYKPITQWFTWHDSDLDIDNSINELNNAEVLIVGSGALGCELLKNLAFLNIKKITIADSGIIKKSNLTSQFLFHSDDIGKLKSQIAATTIKIMKPKIQIEYFAENLNDQNIIFTNKLFKTKTFSMVFNASNNIDIRRFIDNQCFINNIPLFESNTFGVIGNTQPIIPFLTETVSNLNEQSNEKSFAVCTIKNFPNEIHHTIYWALEQFEFFNRGANNINIWLNNKKMKFTNDIKGFQMNKDIWLFTTKYNIVNWKECAIWAIDMFYENYYEQILQLLDNFPSDLLTVEGLPFWSSGKRCPIPIKLDINNKLHLDFINSTIYLLCSSIGIISEYTIDELIMIINEYKIKNLIIASNDMELNKENKKIQLYDINENNNIINGVPQIFEKNNDHHIKWIMITANLRAINYSIGLADFYTTKGITGNITPSINTTTSIIAGLSIIEMIKYLKLNETSKFKSTSINLSLNTFISQEPLPANILEIAGQQFNSWHKFIETNDLSLDEFLIKYNKLFKTTISMISLGSQLIFADFINNDITNKLSNLIKNSDQYILTISSEDDTIELPDIEICL
jgi:ubiquitin-activating enzyme E1